MAHQETANAASEVTSGARSASLRFLIDTNLGLKVDEEPVAAALKACGITAESSTDLPQIDQDIAAHKPDIAHIPIGDFLRLLAGGDRHYTGLAQATSKFSGQVTQRSLLVVRKDDPARSLLDLEGATYAIINRSCSSTYFPAAISLGRHGRRIDEFLRVTPVTPGPTWQGLVDAVVSGEVRATMVLEDVWRSQPKNEQDTKVIGDDTGGLAGVVVARTGLDEAVRKTLTDALLAWLPAWDAVYGPFKPFYSAEVHAFLHDITLLPEGE